MDEHNLEHQQVEDSPMGNAQHTPILLQHPSWKENAISDIFYRADQKNASFEDGEGGVLTARHIANSQNIMRLANDNNQEAADSKSQHINKINSHNSSKQFGESYSGSAQSKQHISRVFGAESVFIGAQNSSQIGDMGRKSKQQQIYNDLQNDHLLPLRSQNSLSPMLTINRQNSHVPNQGSLFDLLMQKSQELVHNSNMQCSYTQSGEDALDNPFKVASDAYEFKQNYHPLTTGRKTYQNKNVIHRMFSEEGQAPDAPYPIGQESIHSSAKQLLSPQSLSQHAHSMISGNGRASILSAGGINRLQKGAKSSEKLMDRFIPYRLGENLQAKFEAVSQKYEEEIQYNADFRTSQLVQELGLNLDQPLLLSQQSGAAGGDSLISQNLNQAVSGQTLSHQSSMVSQTTPASTINGGTNSNRNRGFSNIFGGISTLDQVNGFALNRQNSNNANGANNTGQNQGSQGNPSSSMYPVLPNTAERDLQTNIQNYSNLLEQQIFEDEENMGSHHNIITDETRNLSLAIPQENCFGSLTSRGAGQASLIKENRSDQSNTTQTKPPTTGALSGKIFKFKKNNQPRNSINLLTENALSYKNPFTTNFFNLDEDHSNNMTSLNPFAPIGRKIAEKPYKVLDAPALSDDFYLNLVDWSQQNMLAVALGSSVYVWNAFDSSVSQLCELEGMDNQVTSVAWSQKGQHLCVGNRYGEIAIWDVNQGKEVRTLTGHSNRVGACSWNGSLIATGSRDRSILVRDVRAQENYQQRLLGHKQEVCGLKWSMHDENQIASGGNDNKLFIWEPITHGEQYLAKFSQHQAAVKAIGWSPQQRGLLATGGGTADQCIRFWNTLNLQHINSVNTGSQVCNLMFSRTTDEIVSTHGYSLNQIIVWKYPSMEKISTLTGHTFRVLYLAMSPDGASIVTGAGDETLRFWNVFPKCKSNKGVVCLNGTSTRNDIGNVIGNGNSTLFPSNVDFR